MLEKPDLQDETIISSLDQNYGLAAKQVTFLPLGADINTAVYRIDTSDGTAYFLKLRSGHFNETAVLLPKFLSDLGIAQIIPPLAAKTGRLWGSLNDFKVILYPFIEGCNGYETNMQQSHWASFGKALRRIHAANIPAGLIRNIRQETYAPHWREPIKRFLREIEISVIDDPIALKTAVILRKNRALILDLIARAERYAKILQAQPLEKIVCHSDIHAGNIYIGTNSDLYIVDWDEPILAPKERDLMYIGAGLISSLPPSEEETLFYQAYGRTEVNSTALAYYRYERIIEDIALYCEQLLLSDEGGQDRAQSLQYLKSNFLPAGTIEIAYQSDMI